MRLFMISPPSRGYGGKSNKVIDIKELWMSSEEFYKFKGPQYWHHGGLTVPSPPHNHTHPCLRFRAVGQTTGTLGAPECNVTFILIAPFSQFTCAQGWPGKIKKKQHLLPSVSSSSFPVLKRLCVADFTFKRWLLCPLPVNSGGP